METVKLRKKVWGDMARMFAISFVLMVPNRCVIHPITVSHHATRQLQLKVNCNHTNKGKPSKMGENVIIGL